MTWHLIEDLNAIDTKYMFVSTDSDNTITHLLGNERVTVWTPSIQDHINSEIVPDSCNDNLDDWIVNSAYCVIIRLSFNTDLHPIDYLKQNHIELFI